jgi:hypothetical protein
VKSRVISKLRVSLRFGWIKKSQSLLSLSLTLFRYYVSCVCEDATLSLIKLNQGTQVCCPIVLDSRAAVVNSALNYCMCLTSNAYLYVWRYFDSSGDNNHVSDSEAGNFFNLTALISQLPCQFLLRG